MSRVRRSRSDSESSDRLVANGSFMRCAFEVRISRSARMDLEASFVAAVRHVVARGEIRLPPVVAQGLADAIETRGVGCCDLQIDSAMTVSHRLYRRARCGVSSLYERFQRSHQAVRIGDARCRESPFHVLTRIRRAGLSRHGGLEGLADGDIQLMLV